MDNSVDQTPKSSNKKFSTGSAFSGLIIGVLLSASFWAGHYLWTDKSAQAPIEKIVTSLPIQPNKPSNLPVPELLGNKANLIADIAEAATQSVVNIDTRVSVTVAQRSPFHQFGLTDPFFGDATPFDRSAPPQKYESKGAGSGVIIREDGYILTNNHVVQNADEIKVTLSDKRIFIGKVVGKDRFTDLALVKVDTNGLKAAKLGKSNNLRPGDWAIAIGSPLGLSQTVTLGIISAIGRSIATLHSTDLIQTDAAINPGNSGGPLLNIYGEVIGINTAIRGDGQNIGFAIPIDVARITMEQLIANGSIQHAYLGIAMQDLDEKLTKFMGLSAATKGVLVIRVGAGSPADQAGLVQGDLIQRVNGQPVAGSVDVQQIVRAHKPGDSLNMLIIRGQTMLPITVKIGNYEEASDRTKE